MGDHPIDRVNQPNGRRNSPKCRCVVLVEQKDIRLDALIKGLIRRGAEPLLMRHPIEVMAALASSRRAVVVVVLPQSVRRLPQLLNAIRLYHSHIACWGYQPGCEGRPAKLAPIDRDRISSGQALRTPPAPVAEKRSSAMAPQRSEQPDHSDVDPLVRTPKADQLADHLRSTAPDGRLPEPLLTPEELSMLIGPQFGGADEVDEESQFGKEARFS